MLQVICRPEATSKEEAYTFHTVHSTSESPSAPLRTWLRVVCLDNNTYLLGDGFLDFLKLINLCFV